MSNPRSHRAASESTDGRAGNSTAQDGRLDDARGQHDSGDFNSRGDHTMHPFERGFQRAFGFAVPRGYPYEGIASAARRGRFLGRGPKGYRRSDERIREEICDRLLTHPDIDASDIEVVVRGGIATLAGTVEDRHEKRLAEFITEDAVGVDDVDNRLKVRHGVWAAISGERAADREVTTHAKREVETVSHEGGRATAARNAARRSSDTR